ncbi:hypothetical protein [Vibrio coralliilyticus]|uniref:hypothetical protein n=1 Tax=Vibrio coralliilyticus TaxID=190893 RepID=UPI001F24CD29|nr:hypothetical protein [Vibrio coralliilyticus]
MLSLTGAGSAEISAFSAMVALSCITGCDPISDVVSAQLNGAAKKKQIISSDLDKHSIVLLTFGLSVRTMPSQTRAPLSVTPNNNAKSVKVFSFIF